MVPARRSAMMLVLDLFLILHEHHIAIVIYLVTIRVARAAHHLHLVINIGARLSTSRELLTILGSLVDNGHVLQVVDVGTFHNKDSTANL